MEIPFDWPVTGEASRTFRQKLDSGFLARFLSGDTVLDIGYKGYAAPGGGYWGNGGYVDHPVAIVPQATGIDLDYPGYDGHRLPFEDNSVDAVYSSHMLEHAVDTNLTIQDWYRVIKIGGYIVCAVPHQFLYEKKRELPPSWNGDHKRFYTPAKLLADFEAALAPNSYRIRYLCDNDRGYDYSIGPEAHAAGEYEIDVVVQKIAQPAWDLA